MVAHTVAKTARERTIFFAELIKFIAHLIQLPTQEARRYEVQPMCQPLSSIIRGY